MKIFELPVLYTVSASQQRCYSPENYSREKLTCPLKNQQLEVRRRNPFLLSPRSPVFMGAIFLFFSEVYMTYRSWTPQGFPPQKNHLKQRKPHRFFKNSGKIQISPSRPTDPSIRLRIAWIEVRYRSFLQCKWSDYFGIPSTCVPTMPVIPCQGSWEGFDRKKIGWGRRFVQKSQQRHIVWKSWIKGAVLMIFCKKKIRG